MTRSAIITVVHGRHSHLMLQESGLARLTVPPDARWLVAVADPELRELSPPTTGIVEYDRATAPLPIARARNIGARCALDDGAELLIFLDVDCIPSSTLVADYLDAHNRVGRDALLSGPVTYLPPAAAGYDLDRLEEQTSPHPARPVPAPGTFVEESNHDLFWSLNFALSSDTWNRIGGFCEDYLGYGGEDTDFAAVANAAGIPLMWWGGAHAYHQHHPISNPPTEHLHDIVTNARVFQRRWGRWPMTGWLDSFENQGLIVRDGSSIAIV